jgi:hypothetical protein
MFAPEISLKIVILKAAPSLLGQLTQALQQSLSYTTMSSFPATLLSKYLARIGDTGSGFESTEIVSWRQARNLSSKWMFDFSTG